MNKPILQIDPTCTFYPKGQCERPMNEKHACWNINVNVLCRVQLTAYGLDVLKQHDGWMLKMKTHWNPKTRMFTTELWDLMKIFGESQWMGNPKIPFVNNKIEILGDLT